MSNQQPTTLPAALESFRGFMAYAEEQLQSAADEYTFLVCGDDRAKAEIKKSLPGIIPEFWDALEDLACGQITPGEMISRFGDQIPSRS